MTLEELSAFDGYEGRPAYVAVSGAVYDLSTSPRWVAGDHEGVHQAGRDLTEELKSAPHVRAVIERFPVVGRIEEPVTRTASTRTFPWIPVFIGVVLLLAFIIILRR